MTANDRLTVTIQRAVHDKNFFRLLNRTAQDSTLSYAALGLLVSLLSRPTDWQVKVRALMRPKAKRDAVYALLHELAAAGYVTLPTKRRNPRGQWNWTPWLIHESPQSCPSQPCPAQPDLASPDSHGPEIPTNHRPINDRQTQKVVSEIVPALTTTESDSDVLQHAPRSQQESSDTDPAQDAALRLALTRLQVSPRLADQLVSQYGVDRVWQVVGYMQQPANAGLGIGWLRTELKHPSSVPLELGATHLTLKTLEAFICAFSDEATSDSRAALVEDSSLAFRVDPKHTAATLWAMVAHQLVLKGFQAVGTAVLVAYDPGTRTYTVRVSSERLAQQLNQRYGKHVQATLTALHPLARVVFVPRDRHQDVATPGAITAADALMEERR